jgi:hypothetical protein
MYRITQLVVLALTAFVATASERASALQRADIVTHRDAGRHFSFEYPAEWKINTEGGIAQHYKRVLVAVNSMGKESFYVREQQTSSTTFELNAGVIAGLIPPGSAYLEVSWWEGPFGSLSGISANIDNDMGSRDLSGLLKNAREDANGWRTLSFMKWGKSWEIAAYLTPPVKADVRQAMERVLASFRFDAVPVGDSEWAVMQAYKLLPEEANPSMFALRGSRGNQSVNTRRVADDMIVTFTHDDGQPGRKPIRTWIYHVDSQSKATAVAPEDVGRLVERIQKAPR